MKKSSSSIRNSASLLHIPVRLLLILFLGLTASGCLPELPTDETPIVPPAVTPTKTLPLPTPLATRPAYQPGELVDYTAQIGDTLESLAARFNTTVAEIRTANPIIPLSATTMPTGMPMKIPIYYRPLWGTSYQIIPDSLFINGPAQRDFDSVDFVNQQPGWFKNYTMYMGDRNRRGGEVIDYVTMNYSISPRLLLALVEYQTGALTNPIAPEEDDIYSLGKNDFRKEGLYRQLAWAADVLDNNYYDFRAGKLLSFEHLDGRLERPDPWQNAATVSLQVYFALSLDGEELQRAISGVGIAQTYRDLFGDPWSNVQPHLPGSLEQPAFRLPFEPNMWWAYTGGPHNSWGDETSPLAAIDFAPPSVASGCIASDQWATAVADGVIVRTGIGIAVLDLDGDYDERTGWNLFYLHLETSTIPPVGTRLKAGQHIGRPSCEGGHATGTHIHIARKFNGEWMLAEGVLAFNLEGWVAKNGSKPYEGTMTRSGQTIFACTCSDKYSQLASTAPALTSSQP